MLAALGGPVAPAPLPGAGLEPGFRRRWLGILLPAAFASLWLLTIASGYQTRTIGLDARIYDHGSSAWLSGANPWQSGALLNGKTYSYAGLPPTTILFAPFTVLPEEVDVWLWVVASIAACVLVIRVLRLPLAWVIYPPLLYGALAGNPHVVLLALLLVGGTAGGVLASAIKVVSIPPLIGERRWLAVAASAIVLGLTVLVAPGLWSSFLHQAGAVSSTIHTESGGGVSAWGNWPLFGLTAISLVVLAAIDLRAAGWLVVPALFPTTQYYYAMFALPVDPFLAAAMAFPLADVPAIVTVGYAIVRLALWWRDRRRTASGPVTVHPGGAA